MRVRAVLGLVLVLPVLAAGPVAAAPFVTRPAAARVTAQAAARATARSKSGLVEVGVESAGLAKGYLTQGGKVRFSGTLANGSAAALPNGVQLQLYYSAETVNSRGLLTPGSEPTPSHPGPAKRINRAIGSGASVQWRLPAVSASAFADPSRLGTYTFRITATDPQTGRQLATQTTFVVFAPKKYKRAVSGATKVSWVLPLTEQPHRIGNDTSTDFLDNSLDADFGGSGRLGRILAAGTATGPAGVTWAVDPALLADAKTMSTGYRVGSDTKTLTSQNASSWLAGVRTATTSYFTLPYANADTVALVRQHLTGLLTGALTRESGAAALLGHPADSKLVWPADGYINTATLKKLAPKGDRSVSFLLTGAQLASTVPNQVHTPGATAKITANGQRTALGYDATISQLISQAGDTAADTFQAEQLYLAQTAVMTTEQPASRSLVVAPAQYWNPAGTLAADLIRETATAPWLTAQPLAATLSAKPTADRQLTAYPQSERKRELSKKYLSSVAGTVSDANGLAGIYAGGTRNDYADGVQRAVSAGFRGGGGRAAGNKFLGTLTGSIQGTLDGVHIVKAKSAAMANRTGRLPWTIANNLPDTVRVRLVVTSRNPDRLKVGGSSQVLIETIEPHSLHPVYIGFTASANGVTAIELSLYTPDGKVRFDTVETNVSVTGYAKTALIIVGLALAALVVGVGLRARRARRRRKIEEEQTHAAGDSAPADGDRTTG